MKILVVCTGNSCRSQMATAYLKMLNSKLNIQSARVKPEKAVNQFAVMVMKEKGIDISYKTPVSINHFIHSDFDYLITLSEKGKNSISNFKGKVGKILHIHCEDPADTMGTDIEIIDKYREIRDIIFLKFNKLNHELFTD